METSIRKKLITTVTFLAGLYFFLEFLLPEPVLTAMALTPERHSQISTGFVVVGTMAFGLGIINLLMVHGSTIIFRRKNWSNSLALLLGLFVMLTVAVSDWMGDMAITEATRYYSVLADFSRVIVTDATAAVTAEGEVKEVPPVPVRTRALLDAVEKSADDCNADIAGWSAKVDTLTAIDRNIVRHQLSELQDLCNELVTQQAAFVVPGTDGALAEAPYAALGNALNNVAVGQGKVRRVFYKYSTTSGVWKFLFNGLYENLGAAMFSILGIYIAAAAFRAFMVRSFESSLMMLAAVIVMLGQIPFGLWLYEGLPDLRLWLLQYPNSAAFRAIKFGASIAMLVMAFRMWLSLESDYSGAE